MNIVVDKKVGWAISYFANSIKDNIKGIDVNLIDFREPTPPKADITHFGTWYLYRDAKYKPDNKRIVVTIHHLLRYNEVIKELSKNKIKIVTMSSEWYYYLLKKGYPQNFLCCIPHGIDLEEWRYDKTKLLTEKCKEVTIGIVGRVYADGRKCERLIVPIVQRIKSQNYRLIIIGEGWENIVREAKKISNNVVHYNEVSSKKLKRIYQQLSILLCTSDIEGGPLPILEAMACGVTPVSTPVGLSRDLLPGNRLGYLFPKGDVIIVAKILNSIINGTRQLIKPTSLRNAVKPMSWRITADSYSKIYKTMVKNEKLPRDPSKHLHASKINYSNLNIYELMALLFNPLPTDKWTQPIFWRFMNKILHYITGSQY